VFRARLILALADVTTYREIARTLKTSLPTIAHWKMRFGQDDAAAPAESVSTPAAPVALLSKTATRSASSAHSHAAFMLGWRRLQPTVVFQAQEVLFIEKIDNRIDRAGDACRHRRNRVYAARKHTAATISYRKWCMFRRREYSSCEKD
jgi:hypothetical protein